MKNELHVHIHHFSSHGLIIMSCTKVMHFPRGVGIGGATGVRTPLNFPVGGLKLTKLVGLDTVATLIIMCSNTRSGLRNLDNFNI